MDIRFKDKNIFEVSTESIVYFSDNSLIGERSDVLINRAGNRILDTIQKLNGCATGEVKIIPGYDLEQNYVLLSVLPEKLESEIEKNLFKKIFSSVFSMLDEYNISSFAIDVNYMKTKFGDEYIKLLNEIVRSEEYKYSDYTIYMCK